MYLPNAVSLNALHLASSRSSSVAIATSAGYKPGVAGITAAPTDCTDRFYSVCGARAITEGHRSFATDLKSSSYACTRVRPAGYDCVELIVTDSDCGRCRTEISF